jgi:hypothetical protein
VHGANVKVDISIQPANGLRLEPDILYFVGEWMPRKDKPKLLVLSLVSLDSGEPGADRLHQTFEVQAPTTDIRDDFLDKDCVGVPPHPIVLVPRLVPLLPAGTRNDKVQ